MPAQRNMITKRIIAGRGSPALNDITTSDLLDALAPLLRVRPELDDFCRFGGACQSAHAPNEPGWAQFHIVTRGACALERPAHGPLELDAGDILLLPHGDSHVVRNRGGGRPGAITTEYRNAIRTRTSVDIEPDTELVCGRLRFEAVANSPLVSALPDVIVLRTRDRPLLERFHALLQGIRDELDGGQPGARAIASDLASALFVMMLRFHFEQEAPTRGVLALIGQRATAKVVLAMLREPERNWTLDDLAAVGVISRATLVRAFQKTCGMAPMVFLVDLRMDLARRRLVTSTDPIGQIAADIGYQSEAALSRAFVRRFGIRPGAVRADSTLRR